MAVGISEQTYINWMRWGEKSRKGLYFSFFESVKKAEAQAIARNVAVIQTAAKDSWQAAAWWLERKHPHEWGKSIKVDDERKEEKQSHLCELSDEELEILAKGKTE
jgi:hypothetical protein